LDNKKVVPLQKINAPVNYEETSDAGCNGPDAGPQSLPERLIQRFFPIIVAPSDFFRTFARTNDTNNRQR
jgi:hypothetical protein